MDISAFTTVERRQVTDLLLELGERSRAANSEGLTAFAVGAVDSRKCADLGRERNRGKLSATNFG